MKPQRIIAGLFIASVPFFAYYAVRLLPQVGSVSSLLSQPKFWAYAIPSTLFILSGHAVRADRFKVLTNGVKPTELRQHIKALGIGYLFNSVLPFRLGEVIRAIVLGADTRISNSYLFVLIVLERAFDAVVLGVLSITLGLIAPRAGLEIYQSQLFSIGALLLLFGSIFLGLIWQLKQQRPLFLRQWHRLSSLFNDTHRISLQHKLWSVIYGLQTTATKKNVAPYMVRTVLMWLLYIMAALPLLDYFANGALPVLHRPLLAALPFLSVSVPSGPANLGSYQTITTAFFSDPLTRNLDLHQYLLFMWSIQIIPVSLFGLAFLRNTSFLSTKSQPTVPHDFQSNKLSREFDFRTDLTAFLDSFFSLNSISHAMHRLEVDEKAKLVRYFRGGSNAVTALFMQNDSFVVKKITPIQHKAKLKNQYDWLKNKSTLEKVVNVVGEVTEPEFYHIDIEYRDGYITYFDFIHQQPTAKSRQLLSAIYDYVFANFYDLAPLRTNESMLITHIENRCLNKISQAAKLNPHIAELAKHDQLIINGQTYDNIHVIIDKILQDERLRRTLATYRASSIHGDITVDNILIAADGSDFLLIDPTDNENEISGPVFEFGRTMQSVRYGYEFHLSDDTPVIPKGNVVTFNVTTSRQYGDLYEELQAIMSKHLKPEEIAAVPFHAAVNYSRMLTHRVVINPDNAARYYALSVIGLNEFIDGFSQS